jgi:putative SOS response-associated peptidase YedK
MCGRYALYGPKSRSRELKQELAESDRRIIRKLVDGLLETYAPRYNIAPQQGNPANFVPIVRHDEAGNLEAVFAQWWLLPHWSREPRIRHSTYNARVESVGTLASFREPFKRRRCLIPASGWYEWQELPSGNLPWFLQPASGDYALLAGLWDRWERGGEVIESCAIIVGSADEAEEPFHDRAPWTVEDADIGRWLDSGLTDPEAIGALLRPFEKGSLKVHRVDRRVNKAAINEPELIEPFVEER